MSPYEGMLVCAYVCLASTFIGMELYVCVYVCV